MYFYKWPFRFKVFFVICIFTVSVTSTGIYYIYNEISGIVVKTLQKDLRDVGNLGSLLFDKESRDAIKRIKSIALKEASIDKKIVELLQAGGSIKTISENTYKKIHSSDDFQKILLRLRLIGHATFNFEDNRIVDPLSDNYNFDIDLFGYKGFLGGGIGAYLIIDLIDTLSGNYGMYIASAVPETTKEGYPGNPVGNVFRSFVSLKGLKKGPFVFDNIIKDDFYESLTASIPIIDDNNEVVALLGLDYSVGPQLEKIYKTKRIFVIAILVNIIFSVIISYVISNFLSNPLKTLHKSAVCVSNKNYDCKVDIRTNDEFGFLGKIFNEMIDSIQRNFAKMEDINKNLESIVEDRTRELIEKNNELELLSTTDTLTGLYNRRYIDNKIKNFIKNCDRYNIEFSIIMIDIDKFKLINDNYGHDKGDFVLVGVSGIIKNNIRNVDCAGRWGGEEFVILCQEKIEGSVSVAEKIRNKLISTSFENVGTVTASFGCSQYVPGENFEVLLKRADSALYIAKCNGRNRVECSC
ncbi:diguanylate cyclase [Desulfobulbus rhabdoformis]|uniref:sensor domain-containing diguanylate cyclase n=1 Tax=Desulfobulbus rhabdoformis TaxID=34032 RepID=UPI00196695D2|nr:diguanylate cyclase [Desulfobulbus rhabdoformis]MBM9614771.1 diguanylate cyclase [Desulfobulbus rhabdoformis]